MWWVVLPTRGLQQCRWIIQPSARTFSPTGFAIINQEKRATLVAKWTPEFCDWLLGGMEALQEESAQVFWTSSWSTRNEAVGGRPNRVGANPRGTTPTTPIQQTEFGSRYDYISFSGTAAMVSRTMRSTLLIYMLRWASSAMPGWSAWCSWMAPNPSWRTSLTQSPMATPKAAFQRPMVFNERILSDAFYVWDIEGTKYAVTHIIDAFSVYTRLRRRPRTRHQRFPLELIQDRWIGVFGPLLSLTNVVPYLGTCTSSPGYKKQIVDPIIFEPGEMVTDSRGLRWITRGGFSMDNEFNCTFPSWELYIALFFSHKPNYSLVSCVKSQSTTHKVKVQVSKFWDLYYSLVSYVKSQSTTHKVKVQVSIVWDLYFNFETCTLTFCMTELGKDTKINFCFSNLHTI